MSLTTIAVPKEYGYVLAVAASTFFVGTWHGLRIGRFRKPAGIPYPKAFADSADIAAAATPEAKKNLYLFNCAQRAHANYVENQTSAALAMLIAGLRYPVASAALGAVWSAARVVYAIGYTRADKEGGKGRGPGFAVSFLAQFGLMATAAWTGISLVL